MDGEVDDRYRECLQTEEELKHTTLFSPFEHAQALICGVVSHWPYPSQPVSLLLCGPSGNGKTHVVRTATQLLRERGSHRRVIEIMPHLSLSLSRHLGDGSTALRKDIRIAIRKAVADEATRLSGSVDLTVDGDNGFAVVVVLDHMELFITSANDAASSTPGDVSRSDLVDDASSHHPVVLCDLYDVLRGRRLFDEEELESMNLKVTLFVSLFSGSYLDVDPFAREKLFCSYVFLRTPAELERITFFTQRTKFSPALRAALAARTGGITYRGLSEIIDYAEDILRDLSDEDRQFLAGDTGDTCGHENIRNHSSVLIAESLASAISLRAVRTFTASGSTAAKDFQRSIGYVDVYRTRWDDIAGLEDVKTTLKRLVLQPLRYNVVYKHFGLQPSTGVLLCGPPGTGKTMLARAMATELNASFIYLDLPQLIQAEVGESERHLREFFDAARDRSPSVMFIDELQAAFSSHGQTGSVHDARLVSQFLHLLDAAREDSSYFTLFVGATNVVHVLDEELLRAGRLDTIVEVPVLDEEARFGLVRRVVYGEWAVWAPAAAVGDKRGDVVGVEALVRRFVDGTKGFSGAQLRQVLNVFAVRFLRLAYGATAAGGDITGTAIPPRLDAAELHSHVQDSLSYALSYVMQR